MTSSGCAVANSRAREGLPLARTSRIAASRRAIGEVGLGVVPAELFTKKALEAAGYSELEIAQSGRASDGRWPGRLCGAWRDERGRIGTFWARSLRDSDSSYSLPLPTWREPLGPSALRTGGRPQVAGGRTTRGRPRRRV